MVKKPADPGASSPPIPEPGLPADLVPRYRSAAVARMVRMPVATLRIWERRHGVVSPQTSPAGHRLYTARQVQRLALLKQLTDLGHAISALAGLDLAGLQEVAATHAQALARSQGVDPPGPWRVALVDPSGAARWRARALRLDRPVEWATVAADLEALAANRRARGAPAPDLLLVTLPYLQPDDLARLHRAARACGASRIAVCHGFAPRAFTEALRAQGIALLREPADEAAVVQWLQSLAPGKAAPTPPLVSAGSPWLPEPAPRRYDDATLAAFAQLSSTIACECPRHVAELLIQLSNFEAYSGQCEQRSPDDAALHRYLQQVAGQARALFEAALERVAQQEGLMVPGPRPAARR